VRLFLLLILNLAQLTSLTKKGKGKVITVLS
jgi:hypothetical protein